MKRGNSKVRTHRGHQVREVVERVERMPVMEDVLEDVETFDALGNPAGTKTMKVGEREIGVAVHVRYRREWPDGTVTHGTASEERLLERWQEANRGDQ